VTERRILFIRAVNVGGTARLPMAELRALAEELGATEVSTFIASGNLLCVPPSGGPQAFDRSLEQAIDERFGFFREVISRSHSQLEEALAAFPFDHGDPRFDYIVFLAGEPMPEAIEAARRYPTFDDRWDVIGDHQFIQYALGAGQSQLDGAGIARALGVAGTARNLNSVRKLIALAGD
jgi:uncharacterized protein (DUF1697 family)